MIKLQTFRFETAMGKVYCMGGVHPLEFLTKKQQDELDTIGYTGNDSKGNPTSVSLYLNSLNKGTFSVVCIKSNNMEFTASYVLTRATIK